jgi:hypothetical protein
MFGKKDSMQALATSHSWHLSTMNYAVDRGFCPAWPSAENPTLAVARAALWHRIHAVKGHRILLEMKKNRYCSAVGAALS